MSSIPKAMGYCGRGLDVKMWMQGTRLFCDYKGEGNVTYPNRGLDTHIKRFCGDCKEAH